MGRKGKERDGKVSYKKKRKGTERKGTERKGMGRKGELQKGKERKGKERKGTERKGTEGRKPFSWYTAAEYIKKNQWIRLNEWGHRRRRRNSKAYDAGHYWWYIWIFLIYHSEFIFLQLTPPAELDQAITCALKCIWMWNKPCEKANKKPLWSFLGCLLNMRSSSAAASAHLHRARVKRFSHLRRRAAIIAPLASNFFRHSADPAVTAAP